MKDVKCRPGLYEVRIFSVLKNEENGLGDDGADKVRIFGLQPPLVPHGASDSGPRAG